MDSKAWKDPARVPLRKLQLQIPIRRLHAPLDKSVDLAIPSGLDNLIDPMKKPIICQVAMSVDVADCV
jgi:hypothetical protein